LLLAILLVTLVPILASATTNNINIMLANDPDNEKLSTNGWMNLDDGTISAIGYGAPSSHAKSQAQARLLARRAAIVDAQRNLAEAIKGVQVDSETTMQDLEIASDTVKTKVSAFIKGFTVANEQVLPDGSYQVTLQVKIGNGLSRIITQAKPMGNDPFPQPSREYVDTDQTAYTGVLIEARHLKVDPVWAPKIFIEGNENGNPIFGGYDYSVGFDYLNNTGLAGYIRSPKDIQAAENGNSRAGNNPVRVTALRTIHNNQDIVISQADADKILAANQKTDFLHSCAVAIICKRAGY